VLVVRFDCGRGLATAFSRCDGDRDGNIPRQELKKRLKRQKNRGRHIGIEHYLTVSGGRVFVIGIFGLIPETAKNIISSW